MATNKAAVDDLWLSKKIDPETGKRKRLKDYGVGMRWRVRWTDPYDPGRTLTERYKAKPDAERRAAAITNSISEGQYVDPTAGKVTVQDFGEKWIASLQVRQSTIDNIERGFRRHVVPHLGHLELRAVQPTTVQNWVGLVRSTLSPSTVHGIYSKSLVPLFARAVADRAIGRTPCVKIRLPELPDGEYDLPTIEEVHAITRTMDARYRAVVQIAAGCGLRQAEIFGLELDAVDLDRRRITVRQQVVQSTLGVYLGPPKTRKSRRVVEIPGIAADLLRHHLAEVAPVPALVTDRMNPDRPVEREALLIFPDDRGGRLMDRTRWSKTWWRPTQVDAGITLGRFGLHSLRHFFATTLIFGGANVKVVQLALGHAKPSITLDRYLGYWPDDESEPSRSLIDAALGTTLLTPSALICSESVADATA